MNDDRSFDDVLKAAVASAAKDPEPDPAKSAEALAEEEREQYRFSVTEMMERTAGPAFDKICETMNAAGVNCCMTGNAPERTMMYELAQGGHAAIVCKLDPDDGITVTASTAYGRSNGTEIARFSPEDVRVMVAKMGDWRKAARVSPNSSHELAASVRRALEWITRQDDCVAKS